jgi:cytochrome P450
MARDPLAFLGMLHARYGDVVTLARGTTDFIFAFGPEHNQKILSDPALFHSPSVDDGTTPFPNPPGSPAEHLAASLPLLNGDRHKRDRRLMMPAFHRKRVETYRDQMVELTDRKLAAWAPGEVRDLVKEMRQLTLSVAVRTLFGLDPDGADERPRELMQRWVDLSFDVATILLPYDLPLLPFRRYLRAAERAEGVLRALIEEKRARSGEGEDVMSLLLGTRDEDGSTLSDVELVGHMAGLFVAGHETTAATLSWTALLLSQHPRVLSDLVDELDGKLRGAAPTVEQLAELPLLEAVLKESMRVLPPVAWSQRIGTAPFRLGAYDFAAGTKVIYSPWVTHHLAELYPDPARFLPARWEKISPSLYAYLPFGAGPRMCIGATFAMTELKIVLSMLLQRFHPALAPGARVDRVGFALSSPKSMPMIVERRDRPRATGPVGGNVRALVEFGERV